MFYIPRSTTKQSFIATDLGIVEIGTTYQESGIEQQMSSSSIDCDSIDKDGFDSRNSVEEEDVSEEEERDKSSIEGKQFDEESISDLDDDLSEALLEHEEMSRQPRKYHISKKNDYIDLYYKWKNEESRVTQLTKQVSQYLCLWKFTNQQKRSY